MARVFRAARRAAAVAAVTCGGASVAALLAACGSVTSPSGAQSSGTPAGPASSVTSSPPAASAAPAVKQQCPTSALEATVAKTQGGAAAGSDYVPVDFTNISAHSCVMYGFPGVSWVTGMRGSQIGDAAARSAAFGPATVTLAAGGHAHAWLQIADAGNFPSATCHPVTAHMLRIYPPDQYTSLYASFTSVTCSAKVTGNAPLSVFPVRAGSPVTGHVP